jgi:glyoxylase-like metal-dependent hydrolase (beta-lactamase superfamily II)
MHVLSSLDQLAPDVARLRHLFVNVFLVGTPAGVVLVDAALPGAEGPIRRALGERFGATSKFVAIVLTHGHFDHVGALKAIAEKDDIPVWAHAAELPYLTGRADYPPPEPRAGGGAMALASPLYPRKGTDLGGRVRALPDDGEIPPLPGWRWIATPGHTAGHVSLFRERDRLLISGDAFVSTKQESFLSVVQQRPEIHGPPAYFTPDWESARRSVEALVALRPEAAGTGHGPNMRGEELRRGLEELSRRFEIDAVPKHGRYAPVSRT